ncbi:hypothetical protein STANM309S_04105 [Streptomyces tanashiensis]
MTFLLMTVGPMLAAVLIVLRDRSASRRSRPSGPSRPTPCKALMHCRLARLIAFPMR